MSLQWNQKTSKFCDVTAVVENFREAVRWLQRVKPKPASQAYNQRLGGVPPVRDGRDDVCQHSKGCFSVEALGVCPHNEGGSNVEKFAQNPTRQIRNGVSCATECFDDLYLAKWAGNELYSVKWAAKGLYLAKWAANETWQRSAGSCCHTTLSVDSTYTMSGFCDTVVPLLCDHSFYPANVVT